MYPYLVTPHFKVINIKQMIRLKYCTVTLVTIQNGDLRHEWTELARARAIIFELSKAS